MHSHGPPGPQQSQQPQIQLTPQQIQQLQQLQQQQQQARMMQQQQQQQQPDPEIQAAIDNTFREVKFKVGEPNSNVLLCENHDRQKCDECQVDFTAVNELAARIVTLQSPIPPPPQLATNHVAQLVTKAKEEGNVSEKPYTLVQILNSSIESLQASKI